MNVINELQDVIEISIITTIHMTDHDKREVVLTIAVGVSHDGSKYTVYLLWYQHLLVRRSIVLFLALVGATLVPETTLHWYSN